ncbi:MAG: SPOR domain-containing protein [Gammaproteobacteria bacterium]
MEQKLKERLVGAAVLVAVAVIFIPIILSDSPETDLISGSNIPEKPDANFSSRIIPVIKHDDKSLSKDIGTDNIISEDNQKTVKETVVEKIEANKEKSAEITSSRKENEVREAEIQANVGLSAWVVQLGSFSNEENAQSLNKKLRKAGYPAFVEPLNKNGQISYRVRVGPEIKRSEAELLLKKLKDNMEMEGILVSYP